MTIPIGDENMTGSHYVTGGGWVNICIAGLAPKTQYGRISLGGIVDLSRSNLNVTLVMPFQPKVGNTFDIIVTSKQITGEFLKKVFPTVSGVAFKTKIVQQQTGQMYRLEVTKAP